MPYSHQLFSLLIIALLTISISACSQNADAGQQQNDIVSHLSGQITLSAEIDSVADYSGFEVLVGENIAGRFDTLAYVETDVDGQFATEVRAPRANIYSLVLARGGSVLRVDEIAIAGGDSASFKVEFPFGNRPLMIRSHENAALMGYKNTMALHNGEIARLTQSGENDRSAYETRVAQTSEILWNLQETNPNSLTASLASAQSIVLLEGWDDSLLVARTREVPPDNVNYAAIAGAARRSQSRLHGEDSAVALLNELMTKTSEPAVQAMLQSEIVLAYRDSRQTEKALDAVRKLKLEYATDSTWIRWADRAMYDLENLMPGMEAPPFSAVDTEGKSVNLERFGGKPLVLEFYAPGPDYERELNARNAFYRADEEGPQFEILSISLQPDTLLNEAFFDGRDLPGTHVFLPDGPDAPLLNSYNVYLLPTRFLIDAQGKIVGKFVLENGPNAYREALTLALSEDG